MTLLYVLYALIGISIIIFIHELGHFLAAKRVGVRVERFCVGFDPPVRGRSLRFFSHQIGDTEYVLGMIPFGGYVKMAGETELDPEKKGAEDELMSKSVGARALVFVAGAAMNIISAFFFFILAFSIGVRFAEPEVGTVVTGSPAWKAGLLPGDKIEKIDGKPVIGFMEVMVAVALGNHTDPIDMTVQRTSDQGATTSVPITVHPEWNAAAGFNAIGVIQGTSATLESIEPGSAAEAAGFNSGDTIVGLRVNGVELPVRHKDILIRSINDVLALRGGERFEIAVLRDGQRQWLGVTARRQKDVEKRPQIGIAVAAGNVIRDFRAGSTAANVLHKGDRLIAIDDRPVAAVHWFTLATAAAIAQDADRKTVTLKIARDEGTTDVETAASALLEWHLGGDLLWGRYDARLDSDLQVATLTGTTLQPSDIITAIGDTPCYTPDEVTALATESGSTSIAVTVLREGRVTRLEVDPARLRSIPASAWNTFPPIAAVASDGPAARAGLESGARILRVAGARMLSWEALLGAIQDYKVGDTIDIVWQTVQGDERQGSLVVGMAPSEPLLAWAPQPKLVRAGFSEAIELGAHRTIIVSKWVFLTLRSLFRREVSAKNLQGPIGIAHVLTKVSEQGLGTMIYFLALISVNLGLFNLLPFPILDGGHLFFLLIEKIKGSPVDIRIQEWATNIAFFLIISLAVFVTFNDLTRLLN